MNAGAGTILDSTRLGAPLIVMANPALQGNHQRELAEAVDVKGWAVHAEPGYVLLPLSSAVRYRC
jgi:UDP-N-acetylglucosamine transferase subunit ALG13